MWRGDGGKVKEDEGREGETEQTWSKLDKRGMEEEE